MAVNPALYLELSKALSRPSKAYRAASAALEVPEDAVKGYAQGTDLADKFATRRLANQTLEEALGNNVPEVAAPYRHLTVKQFEPTAKLLLGLGALDRANRPEVKLSDFMTPEQAKAFGVEQQVIDSYGGKPIPRQVATSNVSNGINSQKADAMTSTAHTREGQLQNAVLGTAMRYSGAGAAQHAASDAASRLSNLNRAKQIVKQINDQGGAATIRQRVELGSAIGKSLNPTGVLTNEAMNLYIPNSYKGKVGSFQEMLQNQSIPVDFTGFLPELSSTLDRETEVNQGLIRLSNQYGVPAVNQLSSINQKLGKNVRDAGNNLPGTSPTNDPADPWASVTNYDSEQSVPNLPPGTRIKIGGKRVLTH